MVVPICAGSQGFLRFADCMLAKEIADYSFQVAGGDPSREGSSDTITGYFQYDCSFNGGDAPVNVECDTGFLTSWYSKETGQRANAPICQKQGNGNAFLHAYWNGVLSISRHHALCCACICPCKGRQEACKRGLTLFCMPFAGLCIPLLHASCRPCATLRRAGSAGPPEHFVPSTTQRLANRAGSPVGA